MTSWTDIDLSTIDLRTLPAEQWEPLKAEVRRRAHAERTAVLHRLFAAARNRLRGAVARQRLEARSYAASHKQPLYVGGRA